MNCISKNNENIDFVLDLEAKKLVVALQVWIKMNHANIACSK